MQGGWVDSSLQERRYREWVLAVRHFATEKADGPLRVAILEVGAGNNVTTARRRAETEPIRETRGRTRAFPNDFF